MTPADRKLTLAIRANAAVLLLAAGAVFLPTDVMSDFNDRLGLGPFPRAPLVDYLTRSAAACYALHGGMLLLVAADVRRYRPMIRWVYAGHLAFAATLFGIDLYAGMPGWWAVAEAGTIAGVAVGILTLLRRADRDSGISPRAAPTPGGGPC